LGPEFYSRTLKSGKRKGWTEKKKEEIEAEEEQKKSV
jgi:hypothetical protein